MTFPRYEQYKGSGVEWLGEVPAHWKRLALKRVGSIRYGIGEPPPYRTSGVPLVRATNVHAGHVYDTDLVFVDPDDIPERRIVWLDAGDIIVVRSGAYTGDSAIIPGGFGRAIAGFDMVLKCHSLNANYMQYALLSAYLQDGQINQLRLRAAQPHLNAEELGSCFVVVPTDEEQSSIATFLDRETAKINALIAEQQRLIELLKEKRQAVISQAVTKGLDPGVPMKDSGVEWLGKVPAHWRVVCLKFVAHVQTGIAKGKDNTGKATIEVPYLRVANVQDGYFDLEEISVIEIPSDDLKRYRLQSGDVLMNEGGDFDKLGRGHVWDGCIDPCVHQNHVFAVRPHGVSPEWLNAVTGSGYAQFYFMTRSKQSTNLASISSTNVMELPVVIPPSSEQQQILDYMKRQVAAFDELTAAAKTTVTLLQERRTALISAAVTGKIDVRGHAPRQENNNACR